ncbi:hypothetical protein JOC54_000122 [Alkalihalobacillus xiaoxiensis]|uniref:Uncharacterized protein n=1 Tax=Shouchella xiaoxiensis TaxID=766895 RepID=A0ABS2SPG4_9BACI|nr:hypothetical protein [Shouchella xiaoxiensis]
MLINRYILPHLYFFFGYIVLMLTFFIGYGHFELFSYYFAIFMMVIGACWLIILVIKDFNQLMKKHFN